MHQNENLIDLLAAIYSWRKKIIFFCLLTAIGTALISLLMPNYYKATTVFYAASPDLAKPLPVGNVESEREIYGKDTDIDRLISIANSSELAEYLIHKFDLYNHYDIDSSNSKAHFKIRNKLKLNLEIEKNKFDALVLSFEDKDPSITNNLANAARDKVNDIAQRLVKESQKNLLDGYESNISSKELILQNLSNELTDKKEKYKIYSVEAQGESYASSLTNVTGKLESTKAKLNYYKNAGGPRDSISVLNAKLAGLSKQMEQLKTNINLFNKGFNEVHGKQLEQKDMVKQLTLDKERYKQLKATYEAPFSSIHIVQQAEKPIHKSKPKRSFIVIGVTMLAFFLSVLFSIFSHQYKDLEWGKIFT